MEDNNEMTLAGAIYLTLRKAAETINPNLFKESESEDSLYAKDSPLYDFAAMRFCELAQDRGTDLSTIAAIWCTRFCESEGFRESFLMDFEDFLSELPEDGSNGCVNNAG